MHALLLTLALVAAPDPDAGLVVEFEDWTGATLAFTRAALPPGRWYSLMRPLSGERRTQALKLAVREARRYPRGYLRAIGLKTFGLFSACGAKVNDGFHEWSEELGGYAYLGMWDHRTAAMAAYYDEDSLVRTFHHEVFHHVDATRDGVTSDRAHFADSRERLAAALSGKSPGAPLALSPEDREGFEAASAGRPATLVGPVSPYAQKAAIEDRAETARWLMMHLPQALLQIARDPKSPEAQRLLFTLDAYRRAAPRAGADRAWFVAAARRQ